MKQLSFFIHYSRKYAKPIVCLAISLWALFLRFQRYGGRPLWNDELYQLQFMTGPFQPFWERRIYGDFTYFPGDYLLCYPFLRLSGLSQITQSFPKLIGIDKWMLALPHILVTIVGFFLLYRVCERHMKTLGAYALTFFIVCYNSNLIFHSFEFRPYAVLPILSLASFYLSEMVVVRFGQLRFAKKFFLGIFFIFVILFHLYGILIASLCILYFLIIHRSTLPKKELARIIGFFACVYLAVLPAWLWYASARPISLPEFNTFQYISHPLMDTVGFLKSIVGNLVGFKKFYIFLLGFAAWFFIPGSERKKQIFFFLLLIVLPVELIFVADLLKNYMFLQRQFIWVMPLFAILVGWMWDSLIVRLGEQLKPSGQSKRF